MAKVQQFDPQRARRRFLPFADDLKGKSELRRLAVNLKGQKQRNRPSKLLARLADDLPVVLFITAFAAQDRTWPTAIPTAPGFRSSAIATASRRAGDSPTWRLYLPRTFNGSTDELRTTLTAAIAGKKKPPAANPKVKPGIGPAVGNARTAGRRIPAADR